MRHTRAHTRNRRSHHFLKGAAVSKCQKCKKPVLPLTMCENCGTYKGREIVDVLKKLTKKEKKHKERELEAKEEVKGSKKSLDAVSLSKK